MSRPNVHGLPQFLRKDGKGYFLDYFIQEGGLRKRKRVRLGEIPAAQARKILSQHMQEIVAGRFLAGEKPEATFNEAADSFLAYSEARRKSYRNDLQMVNRLKGYFGIIMSISGHKTYAMFKRYNRIDRQDRVKALQQVERQFDTDMTRGGSGQLVKP